MRVERVFSSFSLQDSEPPHVFRYGVSYSETVRLVKRDFFIGLLVPDLQTRRGQRKGGEEVVTSDRGRGFRVQPRKRLQRNRQIPLKEVFLTLKLL